MTHFQEDKRHYWNLQIYTQTEKSPILRVATKIASKQRTKHHPAPTAHGGKSPRFSPRIRCHSHSCRLISDRTNLKDTRPQPRCPVPKNLHRAQTRIPTGEREHERDCSQTNGPEFATFCIQIPTDRSNPNGKKITKKSSKNNRSRDAVKSNKSNGPNHDDTNKGRRRTCVYLTRDPPRLLATGRRRRVGRERKRSRQDRRRKNPNETKRNEAWGDWEGSESLPRLASPRLVAARTKQKLFFFCVRVRICLPDRWERKGREAPTSRRVKGQASTGPTRRWQRETASRAVAFVGAKCPAGDVICDSLTSGPICWAHTERGAPCTCLGRSVWMISAVQETGFFFCDEQEPGFCENVTLASSFE